MRTQSRFCRVVDHDAAQMPDTELVGGPTDLPGMESILFLGIWRPQTRYEEDGLHAAIKAVHSLAHREI